MPYIPGIRFQLSLPYTIFLSLPNIYYKDNVSFIIAILNRDRVAFIIAILNMDKVAFISVDPRHLVDLVKVILNQTDTYILLTDIALPNK